MGIDKNLMKVSIPFKRESVSKDEGQVQGLVGEAVSIPFKRESVSKVENL